MLQRIFAFSTLKGLPRPGAPLLLAVCVVALVRAALFAWPDAFATISETSTNDNFIDAECRLRYTSVTKPQVVVMGSSRLVPFPADLLAERLKLPKYAVANTSIFGNSFWTTLAFLRRNPDALRDAKVVVFDILPFQLCVNDMFPENDEVFLKYSTLSERILVMDPADRARAVADEIIFPAWSQRLHPGSWRMGLEQLTWPAEDRYVYFRTNFLAEMNERAAAERPGAKPMLREMYDQQCRLFAPELKPSRVEVQAFHDLVALLPQNCKLLLVWLPVHPIFEGKLRMDPVCSASYTHLVQFVQANSGPKVCVTWFSNPESAGLSATDFFDMGHFINDHMPKLVEPIAGAIEGHGITFDTKQQPVISPNVSQKT